MNVMKGSIRVGQAVAVAAGVFWVPPGAAAQQVADSAFTPLVARPAYAAGSGPVVYIDAAHHNFHTADGRYYTFATLLRRDGYVVRSNRSAFSSRSLAAMDVLVISNAMHEQSANNFAPLPNYSAFTPGEIAAVERWVRQGGSLMLIADHMPIAGHAAALAAAFGLRFQNGFAFDSAGNGRTTFRRSDGLLRSHVITDGRVSSERIDSVTTFTGQVFRADPNVDAAPLLLFPPKSQLLLPRVAWVLSDSTPRIPADYQLQAAAVRHGRGKVAVFGEAAMFSAQLSGPDRRPMGMNHPIAAQNYRFALNTLGWLTADLPRR